MLGVDARESRTDGCPVGDQTQRSNLAKAAAENADALVILLRGINFEVGPDHGDAMTAFHEFPRQCLREASNSSVRSRRIFGANVTNVHRSDFGYSQMLSRGYERNHENVFELDGHRT